MRKSITLEDLGRLCVSLQHGRQLSQELEDEEICVATLLKIPCDAQRDDYGLIMDAVNGQLGSEELLKRLGIKISRQYNRSEAHPRGPRGPRGPYKRKAAVA